MSDTLQDTLQTLIQSGTKSNPALNSLVSDYTRYHVVLVVVGGLFTLGLILLSLFFWKGFRKAPTVDARKWTFEKKTFFYFGSFSTLVGSLMALIVAANVSNVLNPWQGFSESIGLLGTPRAGTQTDRLYQSFNGWLQSGSPRMPSFVQRKIDDRLAWQRPKAIISGLFLVAFVLMSAQIWRSLIRKSAVREGEWNLKERALLLSGVVAVVICLLPMVMVLGNAQGSIAPISLTLFFS